MHLKQYTKAVLSAIESLLPLIRRLKKIDSKINDLQSFSHGSRATYVGNNRVLVKIVVDRKNIAYFVPADDLLLSPWFIITGTYETELTNFFARELKSNSHSIDVGANFGYYSCLMARFSPGGKVIGVEADEAIFKLVRDNIAINGFSGLARAVHAAAADVESELTFFRRITRSGNTSIVDSSGFAAHIGEPPSERFTVKGIPLDSLADEMNGRVDFIKIDVEGAEPLVFNGARKIIAGNPQLKIVMEWSPGQIQAAGFDVPAFIKDLEGLGLKAFEMDLKPLSFSKLLDSSYRTGVVLKSASS